MAKKRKTGRNISKRKQRELIIFLLIVIVALLIFLVQSRVSPTSSSSSSSPSSVTSPISETTNSTLGNSRNEALIAVDNPTTDVYFVEMVKQYGDAVYIKNGNFDMIIDAGQKEDGVNVRNLLKENVTDDTVEMVVVTHPHSDHIGGVLTAVGDYKVRYVLDFGYKRSNYAVYNKYREKRNEWVANGAKYCSALDAVKGRNNCSSRIYLTPETTIDMIDTTYYGENSFDAPNDFDFNLSSVTFILNHLNVSYYFSGDLTDKGEKAIVEKVGNVDVMKATHHGTSGGNTRALLDALQPRYVIISASAYPTGEGSAKQHPSQKALDRFYQTDSLKESKNVYFNMTMGTIKVEDDGNDVVSVTGSEKLLGGYILDDKKITTGGDAKFCDTDWFKKYRTLPAA